MKLLEKRREEAEEERIKAIVFVPSITEQSYLLYLLRNRDSDHGPACAYHRAVSLRPMNLTPGLRLGRPFVGGQLDGSQPSFGPGASGMVRAYCSQELVACAATCRMPNPRHRASYSYY